MLKNIQIAAPLILTLASLLAACDAGKELTTRAQAPMPIEGKKLGFVLATYDSLMYGSNTTAGITTECSAGVPDTNMTNWELQFPSREARTRHLQRCGNILNRGPNCENVLLNPDVIKDPLPFRWVTGATSYGANLDGTQNGEDTPFTCKHEKFVGPDGAPGIDNQTYRFLGCIPRVRLFADDNILIIRKQSWRQLLEISGIDDAKDDYPVEVALFRGRDPLIIDVSGKAVPWQSQRIDEGPLSLIFKVRGRMKNGTITTDPIDTSWEHSLDTLLIRGMTLRVKLSDSGAEAIRVGYVDLERFWNSFVRYWGHAVSGPAAYSALHQLADGYKDETSGACTALSSAVKFDFVRAYLVHPHTKEAL